VDAADTLSESLPIISDAAILTVLAESYGITGSLTRLHGERDLNFLVTSDAGARSILKVHNPAESTAYVDMQISALAHVAAVDASLPVCRAVETLARTPWTEITGEDGRRSIVRALEFLPGRHAGYDEPTEIHLVGWGRMAASLGRALRGFFHPAADTHNPWDIRRFPTLRPWVEAVPPDLRPVVLAVFDRYDAHVSPVMPTLRAQIVHADLSRGNVLVDGTGAITGITDFGDMTHTALVCDLAVVMADVLDGRPDSLSLAPAMVDGYQQVTVLEPLELSLLADLVAARAAAGIVITAWRDRQAMSPPDLGGGSAELLRLLFNAGLDRVSAQWTDAARDRATLRALPYSPRPTADVLAARAASLGPLALTYDQPLHVVRGSGSRLFGPGGESWLDGYNNVPVLGHGHPAVAAATAAQLSRLNTNSRYLQEAAVELAERLIASMPGDQLDRVLLVNSGSEAGDLAWRIARFTTGAQGGIVTSFAYHGVTAVTTDLSPETWGSAARPDHIALVDPPGYDGAPKVSVTDAVGSLSDSGSGLAAMFVDGVFTSDGILGPAASWVTAAQGAVQAAGGLYVADEVQAGFGRTGDHLWSWAANDLQPDLVVLGKPMGNGYPVAAVVGSAAVIDPFIEATDYFSTYGGGTAACAAALAVLTAIESEAVVDNAREVGRYLRSALQDAARDHPIIGEVRGWGLAVGVTVIDAETGRPDGATATGIVNAMRARGVLVGTTGPTSAVLKIRPPLVFDRADADELTGALAEVLRHDVQGWRP
jgi:4-aminobutyrate aminotransferase-like enzyme/aminoglycoside phosphotransferase (APT) family kinase protein